MEMECSNVCTQSHFESYLTTITLSRTVYQQYQISCGWWGSSTCYRTRTQRISYYQQVTRYRVVYQDICCPGWAQQGDSCPIPVCNPVCVNGECAAPSTCSCQPGFDGSQCESDIDECALGSDGCQQNCVNTEGSFNCTCNPGYFLSSDNTTCEDIDECALGSDGCQQNCVNTEGSFNCTCNPGYFLSSDNKTCEDIDECALGSDGCQQNCVNTEGSFNCTCNPGYRFSSDNTACEVDILAMIAPWSNWTDWDKPCGGGFQFRT
ncbi:EGF-like and EMI domain-containing protein 1 [Clytia hemisphaerica]